MAITYTWTINSVFKESVGSTGVEGVPDVPLASFIQAINVTITGTEGSKTSTFDTTAHLYHDPDVVYTDYENITTSMLISWAKNAIGAGIIDGIEGQLTREIASQSTATGNVAWVDNIGE